MGKIPILSKTENIIKEAQSLYDKAISSSIKNYDECIRLEENIHQNNDIPASIKTKLIQDVHNIMNDTITDKKTLNRIAKKYNQEYIKIVEDYNQESTDKLYSIACDLCNQEKEILDKSNKQFIKIIDLIKDIRSHTRLRDFNKHLIEIKED